MSDIITPKHSSENGHWYRQDGLPAYTIVGKNGAERPTTLRDARKENLVPSVTSIIKCGAAPGLTNWMIDQAIMAALTLPRNDGENDADFMARVKADSKEQAAKAAERGTTIHAQVQDGFEHGGTDPYYLSALETILKTCGEQSWTCEQSFSRDGFGGKVDLHCTVYLIDIKTTDKDLTNIRTWDEHALQLAAYRYGLQLSEARCFILYINYAAESKLIELESGELDKGWQMFRHLLAYWYAKTGL